MADTPESPDVLVSSACTALQHILGINLAANAMPRRQCLEALDRIESATEGLEPGKAGTVKEAVATIRLLLGDAIQPKPKDHLDLVKAQTAAAKLILEHTVAKPKDTKRKADPISSMSDDDLRKELQELGVSLDVFTSSASSQEQG